MPSIFTTTICISFVYICIKFAELNMSSPKPNKPVKSIFKETIIVAFSAFFSLFIGQHLQQQSGSFGGSPNVFTEDPNF